MKRTITVEEVMSIMELVDIDSITGCEKGNMRFERQLDSSWTMEVFKDLPLEKAQDVHRVEYSIV